MSTLAIDASIACSGYAVAQDGELIALGKWATKINKTTPTEEDRIWSIYTFFEQLVQQHGVTRLVVEAQYVGTNAKTSMILARVRGALVILAKMHQLEFVTHDPNQIKMAVCGEGKGNANKFEVYDAIRALYGGLPLVDELLPEGGCIDKSGNKAKNDDISDALAVLHTDLLYQKEAA